MRKLYLTLTIDMAVPHPSPKMDVKELLTTIHGLSRLLTHVHSSEPSDSQNEQYLDLNSYINYRVQERTGNYARAGHSSWESDYSVVETLNIHTSSIDLSSKCTSNLWLFNQILYPEASMVICKNITRLTILINSLQH